MASSLDVFEVSFMLDAGTETAKAARPVVSLGVFFFFFFNYFRKQKKAPAYFGPIFTPSLINLNFAGKLASLTGSPTAALGQSCGSAWFRRCWR